MDDDTDDREAIKKTASAIVSLGPPKHVLHFTWSGVLGKVTIKTGLKVALYD